MTIAPERRSAGSGDRRAGAARAPTGNGPRIGLPAVESAADPALPTPCPLDVLGAQTQSMIGSLLARALRDALPGRQVAALVTHTAVRAGDPAFARPTELVGQVYSREVAHVLARKRGRHIARTPRDGAASSRAE